MQKFYMSQYGNKLFGCAALFGLCLVIEGIFDVGYGEYALRGSWERIFGAFTGTAMVVGFGGALVLFHNKKMRPDARFLLELAVLMSFLSLGPLVMMLKFSYFMAAGGALVCGLICCATVIPFGLSLVYLLVKRRKLK